VGVPVHWWHGAHDTTVPLSEAQRFTERVPRCDLAVVADAGHILLRLKAGEIASTLSAV
jgi:pimeloyl-ACP methyl ester carboxylesterase